jgi:hypothetical protein
MNSISPQYGYRAIYGISDEVNNIIQGESPFFDLNSCKRAGRFATKAKLHKAITTFPTATSKALDEILHGRRPRRLVGLVSLPTAIIHDIFSAPYHQAQRRIALLRLSLERKKVENDVLDEILESLCTSLEIIFKMLVRLGLETPESLRQKMQDRRYLLLLTLARLLEGYGSRFAPAGTVYLATQKRLPREHCSGIARLHFDQIHHLKEELVFVGLRSTKDLPLASAAIETWLPRIWQALNKSSVEGDENQLFHNLVQRLRNTHDELPELILPVSKS